MKNACFIVDWDGTVANTIPAWIRVFSELFKNDNIHISEQEIFENVYGFEKGPVRYGITDYQSFNQRAFERIKALFATMPLFPDAASVIKKMANSGKKIAVVTNTQNILIKKAIMYNELSRYIYVTIGRDDVTEVKPNPQGLLKASHVLQCNLSETVYVGDSEHDILAGRLAGLRTLLFHPTYTFSKHSILNNTLSSVKVFSHWKEIPGIISDCKNI